MKRVTMRCGISGLVFVLVLTGCMLAPKYERPVAPVAAVFPDPAKPARTDAAPAATLDWRLFFRDTQLRALIDEALLNNRDLRIAAQRVEEARARYGVARADLFPTLGLGAEQVRTRIPKDLNITTQPQLQSQYQVGLNMAPWELDFWGRIRSLKNAAWEGFMAQSAAQRAATLSLIAQVADAYLRLRELDGRLQLARETVATRSESYRIFNQRFVVGATSRLDLVQVETLLRESQLLEAQLQQARALQLDQLTLLVGKPLQLPVTTNLDPDMLADVGIGLPSQALLQRPDILAAEHALKAEHANIGAARAAFFPQVTLTGAYGTASAELNNLFGSGSLAWNFSPSLSLPLFTGGRNISNLDLAEARRNGAIAEYEKTIQGAFREVADELASKVWLDQQIGILRSELSAQSERVRLSQMRYDRGAVPYLVVLDAQRDLLSVGQQEIQTRRERLSSQIRLYTALGGGVDTVVVALPMPPTSD